MRIVCHYVVLYMMRCVCLFPQLPSQSRSFPYNSMSWRVLLLLHRNRFLMITTCLLFSVYVYIYG